MKPGEREYDYLIVGAGLFGSVFAHEMHVRGRRCLVIDRRRHAGGNVYCERREGINVHAYGAHIFHTDDARIWQYVNRFATFNRFTNSPLANYLGTLYNLPFNMNTFAQMWGVRTPEEARRIISAQRFRGEPSNLEEQALSLVGRDIYERLIKGYTEKQWGRDCRQLPPFIIRRLPLRFVFDNNYFDDRFQGIPDGGYNRLIEALLQGVETRLGIDFFDDRAALSSLARTIVYTGPIDRFYDYRFGHLQYRTVRFEHETLHVPNFQGNAVVNYTDRDTPFTRIIEHKHFEAFGDAVYDNPLTVVSREYSSEWQPGMEPYYPINDDANNALFERYAALGRSETGVLFGGRLADYRYYDMAPTIAKALLLAETHAAASPFR